jgi:cell division septum initiation protein DivIVA
METKFDLVLRGYGRQQVDQLLEQADEALDLDRWYVRKLR